MEWVILISVLTPSLLVRRKWTRSKPGLAIFLWIALFCSALVSALIALLAAVFSIFRTWLNLESQDFGSGDWFGAFLFSFVPWMFLAMAGITLALMGQLIEPHVELAKRQQGELDTALLPSWTFQGVGVCVISLPIPIAFVTKVNERTVIVISEANGILLSQAEQEAVLWHELGHIRFNHNALKKLCNTILVLTPWLPVSRDLAFELETLIELKADQYAAKRIDAGHLETARSLFSF